VTKVDGTVPPVPERMTAVRSTTSPRCSSGVSRRAALTFGPAMCAWMSTPPGITTMPRASIRLASAGTSSTTLPSLRHTSRTSPATPLAGS
jgi:hypothetical protein